MAMGTKLYTQMPVRNAHPPLASESDLSAPKMHCELQNLGFVASEQAPAVISESVRSRGDPGQAMVNRSSRITARYSLRSILPAANFKLLYCFFVIEHGSRKILFSTST